MSAVLDEARRLAPDISARSAEIEKGRTVPADVVAALGKAGTFRMYLPASLGGGEVPPPIVMQVVETLARADPSTAWTSLILNTGVFVAWLDPAVARSIVDQVAPEQGMAGNFSPLGRAAPQDDGTLLVKGRWPFNSGSPHAAWFTEGVLVGDGPPRGPENWRFAFMPAADVTILDNWRAAGLRGTASHDVTADGVRVPPERLANPIFSPARHDAPHFRWSFFSLLGSLLSGFPLGVARRALDELVAFAPRKGRGSSTPMADEQVIQIAVPRAEAALRAARAQVEDALGAAWERSLSDRITLAQRIAVRLAAQHAMETALSVTETTFRLAGGAAVYDDHPLQRCWRDVHVAANHLFFSDQHRAVVGRALLGNHDDDWLI